MQVLSIEFMYQNVNLVLAKTNQRGIRVVKAVKSPFPENWFSNDGIKDVHALGIWLKNLIAANGMASKKCHVVINNNHIVSHDVELPVTDPKKFHRVVHNELINAMHLDSDVVTDYLLLDETNTEEEGHFAKVYGFAINETLLNEYLAVIRIAGLIPETVEPGNSALLKLVDHLPHYGKQEQLLVADIGLEATRLYLYHQQRFNILYTTRYIGMGPDESDRKIQSAINTIDKVAQYAYSLHNAGISLVALAGNDEWLPQIKESLETSIGLKCAYLDLTPTVYSSKTSELQFVNAFGTILRRKS
jgi:Tfp pilus assembly PilM family ATPase